MRGTGPNSDQDEAYSRSRQAAREQKRAPVNWIQQAHVALNRKAPEGTELE